MLVYRVFRNERKWLVKVIHAVIHILAWLFGIVGLKAVFDHHNREDPPIPNLLVYIKRTFFFYFWSTSVFFSPYF